MSQPRLALLAGALVVGLGTEAAAQMIVQPPTQMPGQAQPQSAPPCLTAFLPLREEAEKQAVLTCLVFGLVPALRATGTAPAAAMKAGSRGATDTRERFGMRRGR